MTKQLGSNRKSLATLIREAGAEIGLSVEIAADPSGQGRLMYSIGGCLPLTPGQAADVLGVQWGAS